MIKLREYQEKTISKLRYFMVNGIKKIIMCAPTGSGKTVMFSYMISKAIEKQNKCLILTHRTELLTQAGGTLEKFGLSATIVNPKNKNLDFNQMLYIAMTKTVMARIEKKGYQDWLKSFNLIIIDESHLQDFNTMFEYLNKDTFVIGATATPERKGNQSCLSDFYKGLVNEITIDELIQLGFLSTPHSFGVTIDLSNIKTKAGDYDNEMVGDLFEKMQLYEGVYKNYQRLTPNKKGIVFAPNVKASKSLVEKLSKKGLPIKHVDGTTPENERKEILKWFKETPNALVSNVGILTAGFDEDTIEVVILYRATKSLPLFLQMVGRGSRVNESKKDFYILDFGNNIQRHGFWEDNRQWSLVKKPKNKGIAPVKDCKCGALLRLNIKICPYCGNVFPDPKPKETIEVLLEKLKRTDIEAYKHYQKFMKLEDKSIQKGFKKGWILYQLKTVKDFQYYEKYKNYKQGWANFQIKERNIFQ
jgi:superfamily II DNA or RNA helicase